MEESEDVTLEREEVEVLLRKQNSLAASECDNKTPKPTRDGERKQSQMAPPDTPQVHSADGYMILGRIIRSED